MQNSALLQIYVQVTAEVNPGKAILYKLNNFLFNLPMKAVTICPLCTPIGPTYKMHFITLYYDFS